MSCVCRILALEKLGAVFNQVSTPLQYTPRRFVISPETSSLVIIETDHNAYTAETTQQRKQQMAEEMVGVLCVRTYCVYTSILCVHYKL